MLYKKTRVLQGYIDEEKNGTKVISKNDGKVDCYFLSEENLCKIHDYRPLDCELFPILFQIKTIDKVEFNVRWLVWYCPLTEVRGVDSLLEEAKAKIENILEDDPQQLFDYQEAMYASNGYKKKHFLYEERLKIRRR